MMGRWLEGMKPFESCMEKRMETKHKVLLLVDGIVNGVLGILLLLFPLGIVGLLGLPIPHTNFYPSILGGVLLGIGVALFLELYGYPKEVRGLSLCGAIIINTIGSLVLIGWLLFGALNIPLRGRITLWTIGILVLMIGIVEFATKAWHYDK